MWSCGQWCALIARKCCWQRCSIALCAPLFPSQSLQQTQVACNVDLMLTVACSDMDVSFPFLTTTSARIPLFHVLRFFQMLTLIGALIVQFSDSHILVFSFRCSDPFMIRFSDSQLLSCCMLEDSVCNCVPYFCAVAWFPSLALQYFPL